MTRALFRGPTKGYTMTDEDVEWLARSLSRESSSLEGRTAAAWTMMNRYLLVSGKWLTQNKSFTWFMRAFSQPINPMWASDGAFCALGGKYADSDLCRPALTAMRDKLQDLSIPVASSVYKVANNFAEGKLPNPFKEPTYDFAACSMVANQGRPNTGISVGGNCHLVYSSLKSSEKQNVIDGEVTLGISSSKVITGTLVATSGVVLGYLTLNLLTDKKKKG